MARSGHSQDGMEPSGRRKVAALGQAHAGTVEDDCSHGENKTNEQQIIITHANGRWFWLQTFVVTNGGRKSPSPSDACPSNSTLSNSSLILYVYLLEDRVDFYSKFFYSKFFYSNLQS